MEVGKRVLTPATNSISSHIHMGTPAYSNGYAQFNTTENALNAFEAFKKWADEKNELKHESYGIHSVALVDSDAGVSYSVESMRVDNCEWQCENIRDFFKTQEGCTSVEQDILICETSVHWVKGEDDEEDMKEDNSDPIPDKFMEDERGA